MAEYATSKAADGMFEFEGVMLARPPCCVKKVSDNEVRFCYGQKTVVVTAEGSGNIRYNPTVTVRNCEDGDFDDSNT